MTEPPTDPAAPPDPAIPGGRSDRRLSPMERAALLEAAARRAGPDAPPAGIERPAETGGPRGPEPTRYGDWEKRGLAVDF